MSGRGKRGKRGTKRGRQASGCGRRHRETATSGSRSRHSLPPTREQHLKSETHVRTRTTHLAPRVARMAAADSVTTFRASEVAEHKDKKSAWLIIHDQVYDVSKFLDEVRVLAPRSPSSLTPRRPVSSIQEARKSCWNRLARTLLRTSRMWATHRTLEI